MVPLDMGKSVKSSEPVRDPNGKFTDEEIWEAFVAFDLDKNNFVGAAEIRHVLINIGENVTDEEVPIAHSQHIALCHIAVQMKLFLLSG